jgi:4-diphosphocytidyl-2C-methyl-D-erythritol kinase
MALQFIKKRFRKGHGGVMVPQVHKMPERVEEVSFAAPHVVEKTTEAEVPQEQVIKKKNNKKKSKEDMIDINKINDIEAVVEKLQPEVKVVKADRGLIERTESSKIIITEDNRQVLND